jgi:arylsulfatase A
MVKMKDPELICLAALALLVSPGDATARERPNVLVVLADDLGYGDLGCYGEPNVQTPHLDQFAQEGLRFTNCYAAAASCSPARTGLMTGRTPYRVGIYSAIPFLSPMHLRASETTIATLLGDVGAASCYNRWRRHGLEGHAHDPHQAHPPPFPEDFA